MSLPHGLLGLLRYHDSTGYELAKKFEDSLNNFWHAQASQIYRELNRLEEKGFVASTSVVQQGKPNKRVYSITDAGREEFMQWTVTPAALIKNRQSPLLLYTFFGASDPDVATRRLKALRESIPRVIAEQVPLFQDAIDEYKTQVPNGDKEAVFWQMAVLYVKMEAEGLLQWAEKCIEILEKSDGRGDVL